MWRNPSNNYEEYFRDHHPGESAQRRSQTSMESFNQQPNEELGAKTQSGLDWHKTRLASLTRDRIGQFQTGQSTTRPDWTYSDRPVQCQTGLPNSRPAVPLINGPVRTWDNFESFANDAFCQSSPHSQHQEDEEPENPETISMLQRILEGQTRIHSELSKEIEELNSKLDEDYKELSARISTLYDHYKFLEDQVSKAEGEIEEASNNEDMVQGSGVWNVFPREYSVVAEHQRDCTQLQCLYEDEEESIQFQKDESNEDVQNAQFPLEEEIEEIPKNADMTLEGEVVEVFFPYYEIVVEHHDDEISTQQQSPAGEEVEEIIQLHEDALDEDALALIVAVMNEETLRMNIASIKYETNKEEEEVVQIFELPEKELHQDEAVEPRVPGTPTPLLKHPQGPRKRLEWKIKHKWKIKPRNV